LHYEVLKKFKNDFMKRYIGISVLMLALIGCNNGNDTGNRTTEETKPNAAANDSTPHPSGMTEPSVISVDTAATRVRPAGQ
jgi:hypothetical protein